MTFVEECARRCIEETSRVIVGLESTIERILTAMLS